MLIRIEDNYFTRRDVRLCRLRITSNHKKHHCVEIKIRKEQWQELCKNYALEGHEAMSKKMDEYADIINKALMESGRHDSQSEET